MMKTTVVKSALGKWFVMQDGEPISDQFDTNAAAWRWYDKHTKSGREMELLRKQEAMFRGEPPYPYQK